MWDREHQSRSRCRSSDAPRRGWGIRPAPATAEALKEAQAFLAQAVICEPNQSSGLIAFLVPFCARPAAPIGRGSGARRPPEPAPHRARVGTAQAGGRGRTQPVYFYTNSVSSGPPLNSSTGHPGIPVLSTLADICMAVFPLSACSAVSPSCFLSRPKAAPLCCAFLRGSLAKHCFINIFTNPLLCPPN